MALGQLGAQLIELPSRTKHPVTLRELAQIEKIMLGQPPTASHARLEELAACKVLVPGEVGPDPQIAEELRSLDALFLAEYSSELSETATRAYELTVKAHAWRKRFHAGFGQCPTLPETTLRRALLVGEASSVGTLDILCIGDDDLVCVPLAALGHRVTVFDIDHYLLGLIERIQKEEGLTITAKEHDLRDPIRAEEQACFDVFLTDPMANEECFRLFVSRAIPLLRSNGRGFVAVHGAAQALFESVCSGMHVPITAWHRRHNRYYSHFLKLHQYESDWAEIRKTTETLPSFAADEPVNPVNLYHEDYFHRPTALLILLDGLDEPRFAKPIYLDMVMDGLLTSIESKEVERQHCYRQGWSTIISFTERGHVALHAHREREQICLSAHPTTPELIESVQRYLVAAYKTQAKELRTVRERNFWDLRIL